MPVSLTDLRHVLLILGGAAVLIYAVDVIVHGRKGKDEPNDERGE